MIFSVQSICVAWVIGARGGLQLCRPRKSSDASCPVNTPIFAFITRIFAATPDFHSTQAGQPPSPPRHATVAI